jgi:hypothetical protein
LVVVTTEIDDVQPKTIEDERQRERERERAGVEWYRESAERRVGKRVANHGTGSSCD